MFGLGQIQFILTHRLKDGGSMPPTKFTWPKAWEDADLPIGWIFVAWKLCKNNGKQDKYTYMYIFMDMYGSDIEFSRWKELCVCWQSYYLRQIYHKNSNRTIRQFSIQSGNSVWLAGSAFCLYGCITVLFLLAFNEFAWISLTPTEPTQEQAEQSLQDRRDRVWKFSCKLCFNLTSSEVFAIQPTPPWWLWFLLDLSISTQN